MLLYLFMYYVHDYFFFNSGMENSSLSQMWGRLYFPVFLFRVGLFTLMYMDSLMVLARLLSSLPIILKLSRVVTWPLLLWCRNKKNINKIINPWFMVTMIYQMDKNIIIIIIWNIIKDIKLTKNCKETFSLTDLKKQPCLAAKACQLKYFKPVLY